MNNNKTIVATWNKAEEKLRLLADIERQIVNASINGNVSLWIKLLKSYCMFAQTYFKNKNYMGRIRAIEKTISVLPTHTGGILGMNIQLKKKKAMDDLIDLQTEITDESRKAGLDIPSAELKSLRQRLSEAMQ